MHLTELFKRWFSLFNAQSISTRVIRGFVLMSILTALSITLGSMGVNYSNTRRQTTDRLESVVSLRKIEIQNWHDALQNELLFALNDVYSFEQIPVVLNLAHTNQYYDWYNQAVENRLVSLTSQFSLVRQYCLLDLQGKVVLCTDPEWSGNDCRDEQFFSSSLKAAYFELPSPESTEQTNCWVRADATRQSYVLVSRPVINNMKEVVGVIVGRAASENIASILANPTGLGKSGSAYLASSEYGVLGVELSFDDRPSLLPVPEPIQPGSPYENPDSQGNVISGIFQGLSGKQVMSAGVWLPDLRYWLVVEQELMAVFQSILVNLGVSFGIGMAVMLAAIFTSVFITRAIVRPIDQLAGIAKAIAGGDLERAAPVKGMDEIATLAKAFNSMTAQLKDLIIHLEMRVQERTQTLQQTNQMLERRALQLETISAISEMITVIQDLSELLPEVVTYIGKTFQYIDVRVYLLEEDRLVLKAYSQADEPQITVIPLDATSLNSEAVKTRKSILVKDRSLDERGITDPSQKKVLSELTIPLQVGKRVVGTLDVSREEVDAFSPDDVLLIQSLGDQIAIAIENERLYKRTIKLAVHEERSRLARNLHDSVVQSLYSLNLMMGGWLENIRAGDTSNVFANFERASEIIHQALKEMRLMVYQLNPRLLEREGLKIALSHRLDSVESRAGIVTHLDMPEILNLPAEVEESLYHIAQEALNNALKHSRESEVWITLTVGTDDRETVLLQIRDNGVGFSPANADPCGMGLENMRHRAEEQGGAFSLTSNPGEGTIIKVEIPLIT